MANEARQGARILVTGCASGIGRDLASALIERGDRVFATDVDHDGLLEASSQFGWSGGQVELGKLDVRDPESWATTMDRMEARFGGIDVLVNVAGVLVPQWVHELDLGSIDLQIDVNFKGVVYGMHAVTPRMVAQGSGHVINVASLAALAPVDGIAVYCATKYAVRGFSLAAATELSKSGVAVTIVCPDAVKTPMLELQRGTAEAEMTFSGSRELEPREVTEAIIHTLRTRPREVFLPRGRGWLARLGDVFPSSAAPLGPLLRMRGRKNQTQ